MIFEKLPLAISPHFPLFDSSKHLFFKMCFIRSTIANLYPIMIHFHALGISECHSEEVMFVLMLGVFLSNIFKFTSYLVLSLNYI